MNRQELRTTGFPGGRFENIGTGNTRQAPACGLVYDLQLPKQLGMKILGDLRVLLLGVSARLGLLQALRIEQSVRYSRYSSVAADARTIYRAEGRDALNARLSQFARAISP